MALILPGMSGHSDNPPQGGACHRKQTSPAMTILKFATRLLLLASFLLLTSCIDLREELWVADDGSGHTEITCDLPASATRMHGGDTAMREKIDAFLLAAPVLTASRCEVVTAGNSTRIIIHASFDSAMDLQQIRSSPAFKRLPSGASHLAGEIRADVRGRTLDFTRTLSPSAALPGWSLLPASQLDGHHLVYIIHLPAPATQSNATSVSDAGRTLLWDMPLALALKAPFSNHFLMPIPIPWSLVTTIAVPLSLGCGFGWLKLRKSQRNRQHQADSPQRSNTTPTA